MTSILAFLGRWGLTLVWLPLPVTAGAATAAALEGTSAPVIVVAAVLCWAGWAIVLGASLVPSTVSLTVVRTLAPAALGLATWSVAVAGAGFEAIAGCALAAVATILALSAPVADAFVDGSSYGDETRFALRTPAALLFGPIELSWLLAVAGMTVGPLLLAAQLWIAGGVALAVGLPVAWASWRSLHQLSRRWVVFVPAGFVLHDLLAMGDALLVPRRLVARLGPAPVDSTATDLTLGARGLALEVDFTESTPIGTVDRNSVVGRPTLGTVDARALLFAPCRPGAVVHEAARRHVTVG